MLEIIISTTSVDRNRALATFIDNYVMIEQLDLSFTMHTTDLTDILKKIETSKPFTCLYFIYVSSIKLNETFLIIKKIRHFDPFGKLVLLVEDTTNEIQNLVFSNHLEVLSIINLNSPMFLRSEIKKCLHTAHGRHTHPTITRPSSMIIKIDNTYRSISHTEMICVETAPHPHQISIHLNSETLTCYDTLKNIEQQSDNFIRVHNSFVINMHHFLTFNTETKLVTLTAEKQCLVSLKGRKNLFSYIKSKQKKTKNTKYSLPSTN